MTMTTFESIVIIATLVLGTMLTRFLPFIIFTPRKKAPPYINYLGKVLPFAMIAFLVVYCLKDAVFSNYKGLPELIGIIFIIIVHKIWHNTLFSIAFGTIFYMILVQNIFI